MSDTTTKQVEGKDPWRSAAQTLLDESGCTIVKWRSSGGCAYSDGSRRIEVPQPRGAVAFDTFAHEIGHIVLHERNGKVPRWREEVEATDFALEQFTRFSLKGRQKMRERRIAGIAYAFKKATRRGADPAAIKRAFPGWWEDTQTHEDHKRTRCRKRGCDEIGRYRVVKYGDAPWQAEDWMGEVDELYAEEEPEEWPDDLALYCHSHAEAQAQKWTGAS